MRIIRDYWLEIVLAIFSFTLLLLTVLPYFYGFKIQSDYARLISSVSDNSGLVIEVVSYEKHWFSSNAELMIKDQDKQFLYKFKHKIIHGPVYLGLLLDGRSPLVSMVIKGMIQPAKIDQSFLSKILSANPVQLNAYIGFNGVDEVVALLPAVSQKVDGITFQVAAANLKMKYFSHENRFKGDITTPSILLYGRSHVEVERFLLNFDEVVDSHGVSGDIVLSFDALKFRLMQRSVNLKAISSRFKNSITDDLLNLEMDFNASKLNLFNEQVNSLSFGLNVEKFDLGKISKDIFYAYNEPYFDLTAYEYNLLNIDHFNFFSEYGTFSATMLMKSAGKNQLTQMNYLSTKDSELSVRLSTDLLKRLYELVFSNIDVPVKNVDVVLKNMLRLRYLDKNLDKIKLNVSGKDNVFIINDQRVGFDDLSNNIMKNIFSNY